MQAGLLLLPACHFVRTVPAAFLSGRMQAGLLLLPACHFVRTVPAAFLSGRMQAGLLLLPACHFVQTVPAAFLSGRMQVGLLLYPARRFDHMPVVLLLYHLTADYDYYFDPYLTPLSDLKDKTTENI